MIKRVINKLINKLSKRFIENLFSNQKIENQIDKKLEVLNKFSSSTKVAQVQLKQTWNSIVCNHGILPNINDVEFRIFSQNGEDGIILYLLTIVGSLNKFCVEICCGDAIQCNSANLIINHNYQGLLIDGNEKLLSKGIDFFKKHPDTRTFPPILLNKWIDCSNVNEIIKENCNYYDVDLLSIDMDGIDLYIWDEISVISPRVVVIEFNNIFNEDESFTVQYDKDFNKPLVDGFGIYSGASLRALEKIGFKKGYRLVGVQNLGFNAFFVRNDLAVDKLPSVSVSECLNKPFAKWARERYRELVLKQEWKTID